MTVGKLQSSIRQPQVSWQTILLTYNFLYTITLPPFNIHLTKNSKSFNRKETFFISLSNNKSNIYAQRNFFSICTTYPHYGARLGT